MKRQLSNLQAMTIVVNCIVSSGILYLPTYVITAAREDAWLSILLAMICGLLFALLVGSICRQYEGELFLAWLQGRLGRIMAVMIGLALSTYYFISNVLTVRQFTEYITDQILINTPMLVIASLVVLVSVYISYQGGEAMGHVHLIVFMLSMIFVGINVAFLLAHVDVHNFMPLFEADFMHHVSAAMMPLGLLSDAVIILVLLPHMERPADGAKVLLWAVLISSVILTIVISFVIGVFGTQIVTALSYPAVAVLKEVKFGSFIERLDLFLLTGWMMAMFSKIGVFLFCLLQLITYTLRIKKVPLLYTVITVLVIAASILMWDKDGELIRDSAETMPVYFLVSNYSVCLLIWCSLWLTRSRAKARRTNV